MIRKLLSVLLIVFTAFSINSCGILSNSMESFFEDWEPEEYTEVAIYDDTHQILTIDGENYDIGKMLEKFTTAPQVLLVSNGNLFFCVDSSADGEYKRALKICTLELKSGNIEVLYEGKHIPSDSSSMYEELVYPEVCFFDRTIVIYDGQRATYFDVDTNQVTNIAAEDFSIPAKEIEVERIYSYQFVNEKNVKVVDQKQITIKTPYEKKLVTVEFLAERNEYANRLLNLNHHNNIFFEDVDPLETFFDKGYVIGNSVYLLCTVLDKDGESNQLIFWYHPETDVLRFIYHNFSSGGLDLAIIPMI